MVTDFVLQIVLKSTKKNAKVKVENAEYIKIFRIRVTWEVKFIKFSIVQRVSKFYKQ